MKAALRRSLLSFPAASALLVISKHGGQAGEAVPDQHGFAGRLARYEKPRHRSGAVTEGDEMQRLIYARKDARSTGRSH